MAALQEVTLGRTAVCCIAAKTTRPAAIAGVPPSTDGCTAGNDIGQNYIQGLLPLLALLTALMAAIRQNSSLLHHCQEIQDPLQQALMGAS